MPCERLSQLPNIRLQLWRVLRKSPSEIITDNGSGSPLKYSQRSGSRVWHTRPMPNADSNPLMASAQRTRRQRTVKACERCRFSKLGCDLARPSCSKCLLASVNCSFASHAVSSCDGSPSSLEADSTTDTNNAPVKSTNIARRNRARLSCQRCHRLKIKCDRKLPCSRCVANKQHKQCAYDYPHDNATPTSETEGPEKLSHPADTAISSEKWLANARGLSHWKSLLYQVRVTGCAMVEQNTYGPTV